MEIAPYCLEDCKKILINKSGWYLQGYSRAGQRTGYILYTSKFIFDCGLPTAISQNCVFITHSHVDHTAELPKICSRNKTNSLNRVFAPSSAVKGLSMLERAITILSGQDDLHIDYNDEQILEHQKIQLIPVNYFDTFVESNNVIEILRAYHSTMSVGYGVQSIRKKLNKKYAELSGKEIKALTDKGIDVFEIVHIPELAFYCDTTIDAFTKHAEWKKYPVIVCECTGIDPNDKKTDKDYYDMFHMRITQLEKIFAENLDKHFILIHISSATKPSRAEEIQQEMRMKGYNVTISY